MNNTSEKYIWDENLNLFRSVNLESFNYSDGSEVEDRLFNTIRNATDRSTFSTEFIKEIKDWPSEYHLSRARHCLVRPLGIKQGDKVLELGCGCGALTRYLGEIGAEVVAVEASFTRARITAERCCDLPNVKVFADNLIRFETNERFDWILLVGVLEYAPVFVDEKDPVQYYLRTAKRFLAPDGKFVVAIENKLGLKYFNACSEDHLGIPFFGMQNLYGTRTPRTFGHRELYKQLSSAGFPHCYFYYPFPDYKLPTVVLSDDALKDTLFDAAGLILRSHSRDYSGSMYRLFNEALVFYNLKANELLADFSNSFLVIATVNVPYKPKRLAMTFAINRIPEFSMITSFYRSDEIIHVSKEPIFPDRLRKRQFQHSTNISNIPSDYIYHPGHQFFWDFVKARANKGSSSQLAVELYPWITYLLKYATIDESLEPSIVGRNKRNNLKNYTIPGTYLDCIPFNLIEDSGNLIFIDNEWQVDSNIPLGWVITRGVVHSLSVDLAPGNPINNIPSFVKDLCSSIGLLTIESEITGWIEMEAKFLSIVTGHSFSDLLISLNHSTSGLIYLNDAIVEKNTQIVNLNQAVTEKDVKITYLNHDLTENSTQVTNLNHTVTEKNILIASLNQAVTEKNTQIASLNQVVTEKNTQIASLNQVVTEKNTQIASLNQAVTEKNTQIASLNQSLTEKNTQITRIVGSYSWRLTRPLRIISKIKQSRWAQYISSTRKHFPQILRGVSFIKRCSLRFIVSLYSSSSLIRRCFISIESISNKLVRPWLPVVHNRIFLDSKLYIKR